MTVSGRAVGRGQRGHGRHDRAAPAGTPISGSTKNMEPAADHARRAALRASAREIWSGRRSSVVTFSNAGCASPVTTVRRSPENTDVPAAGGASLSGRKPNITMHRIVPVSDLDRGDGSCANHHRGPWRCNTSSRYWRFRRHAITGSRARLINARAT